MRLSAPLFLLLNYAGEQTSAFTPPSSIKTRHHGRDAHHRQLRMAISSLPDEAPPRKVLTAADVMAKSKASSAGGDGGGGDPRGPGEQDAPKIFSPAIYDDFQSALLTLEKRAKDGPGSLTADEVYKFEEETDRLVKEMREYMTDPEGAGESIRKCYESTDVVDVASGGEGVKILEAKSAVVVEEPKNAPPVPPPVATTQPPPATEAASVAPITPATPAASSVTVSANADPPADNIPPAEDEPTDAASSYGLAKGTTNTYIIPGMEEMSGEEYRAKLQETISGRQANRRKTSLSSNSGIIGNASSQGYLDSLGGGNKQGETRASFDNASSIPKNKKSRLGALRDVFGVVDVISEEEEEEEEEGKGSSDNGVIASATSNDEEDAVAVPAKAEAKIQQNDANGDSFIEKHPGEVSTARLEEQNGVVKKRPKKQLQLGENHADIASDAEGSSGDETNTDSVEATATSDSKSDSIEDSKLGSREQPPQQQEYKSGPAEATAKPAVSPILTMKKSKLQQELSRKSEWHQNVKNNKSSNGHNVKNEVSKDKNVGGRFKRMQTDKALLEAALNEKASLVSPASPLSALSEDDWWGDNRPKQHPNPSDKRKPSYFGLSSESTRSFAHGFEERRTSTAISSKEEGSLPEHFDVHSAGNTRKGSSARQVEKRRVDHRGPGDERKHDNSKTHPHKIVSDYRGPGDIRIVEAKEYEPPKSLVGIEVRQRPVAPTTEEVPKSLVDMEVQQRPAVSRSVEKRRVDHRGPGDARSPDKSSQTPLQRTATDHRGPGDLRTRKAKIYAAPKSLVETETRQRAASSVVPLYAEAPDHRAESLATPLNLPPDYAQVKDRRSAGNTNDMRGPAAFSNSVSLAVTEECIRPSPHSRNVYDHSQVKDHRGPGDTNALTRRDQSKLSVSGAKSSLIECEERNRSLISSSKNHPHGYDKSADYRGPGDGRALTLREKLEPLSKSLIESEHRSRPVVSSSRNFPHGFDKAADHRGPGDDRALTHSEQSLSTPPLGAQSLIKDEQQSRPIVPSSAIKFHGYDKAGADHRGPGDERKVAVKERLPPMPPSSLIENEERVRPTPTSDKLKKFQIGDHRGVGDIRTISSKVRPPAVPSAADTPSLSEDEQRQRPVPIAGSPLQASDHRWPGDDRTITRKVGSSFPATAAVASLSEDEQRLRPAPLANQHEAASEMQDGSDEIPSREEGTQWWNEETQRHPMVYSASTTTKVKVLDRSMDDILKEKESKAVDDESSTLKSLLKDKKVRWLTSVRAKMSPTMNKSPIAEIPPSSLRSLLRQDEEPDKEKRSTDNLMSANNSGRKVSQLSSLLKDGQAGQGASSPTYESRGWYNDSPQRPRGYVKHNQPLKTINVEKNKAPPDYGNVVEQSVFDDDNAIN